MRKIEPEEVNELLKQIRNEFILEINEHSLIQQITQLATEIKNHRQEKEYYDDALKLLNIIKENYAYSLKKNTLRNMIPNLSRDLEFSRQAVIKEILFKEARLNKLELLLDYFSYPDFSKVMAIRSKKK